MGHHDILNYSVARNASHTSRRRARNERSEHASRRYRCSSSSLSSLERRGRLDRLDALRGCRRLPPLDDAHLRNVEVPLRGGACLRTTVFYRIIGSPGDESPISFCDTALEWRRLAIRVRRTRSTRGTSSHASRRSCRCSMPARRFASRTAPPVPPGSTTDATTPPSNTAAEPGAFRRGDANLDDRLDLSDASYTLSYLFLGRPTSLDCEDAADSNDDESLNVADATYTLAYLFRGATPPPAPLDHCTIDPTPDALTCTSFSPCEPEPVPPSFGDLPRRLRPRRQT